MLINQYSFKGKLLRTIGGNFLMMKSSNNSIEPSTSRLLFSSGIYIGSLVFNLGLLIFKVSPNEV